ncbi:MAG: pyruvate flavodoxin/ferredoxin oxidoreductase, partial [Bacteroidetes bacterium]|nr:pyruvate flavodoxin/ferredoxin oxidoreductase [Bacteroidota bacterium]
VADYLAAHPRLYVVEQNRDGQLRSILRAEYPEMAGRLRSVLHFNGLPIDARSIANDILAQEKEA